MTDRPLVVSAVPLAPAHEKLLADYETVVVDLAHCKPSEIAATIEPAQGLLVNSHVATDAELLACMPALRVISTISAGFDHIDVDVAAGRGITVTTAPVLTDAVADLTMTLIVMTERRLKEAADDLARGQWNNALLGRDVRGKRLLLIGFGRIAREVARRALAAKMRVSAFDVRTDLARIPGVDFERTLAAGLERADVVSVHVDLNPSTFHLLDAAALARLPEHAIVINTSRGGVVDQAALTAALQAGRLGGAGLDVLEQEPPDPADPLLSLPNVVVFPHIASATTETRRAMLDCAVANLAACLRGDSCEFALVRP